MELKLNYMMVKFKEKYYKKRCAILCGHMVRGINNINPQSDYIVSLTSYGERLKTVWMTIQSIFDQNCKFSKVILWVAYQDMSQINDQLRMLECHGLTIRYCKDIHSYKKLIYTVKEYSNYNLITVDDDVIYSERYFIKLIKLHKKYPECICCYRAHTMRFREGLMLPYKEWDFHSLGIKGPTMKILPVGIGGILYPAFSFSVKDFDFDVIKKIAPYSDDLYFKWLEIKKGINVVKVYRNKKHIPYYIANTQENSLKMLNIIDGNNNDVAIKNIENYYGDTFYNMISKKFR